MRDAIISLNAPAYAPEFPREILLNIASFVEEEDLPRLALVSRLFYALALDLKPQRAKESLQKRLAWIRSDILPTAIETFELPEEQDLLDEFQPKLIEVEKKLNALQEKLDSAFTRTHITKRRDAVQIRHELQNEICQVVTEEYTIGQVFLDMLSRHINAAVPGETKRSPNYDIPHTLANRRMMQLYLYANACSNLEDAKTEHQCKSTALMDLARSHRPDEALALFKHMAQGGEFPYSWYNKSAVMLLVNILTNANRSSDVEFIDQSLNDEAKEDFESTGDTLPYQNKRL